MGDAILKFLNENLSGFDYSIIKAISTLQCDFLTFLCKAITFLGEKGIIFFALGLILMLFKRTRFLGITIFGAVGLGAIITSFVLKDIVMRARPFESGDSFYLSLWKQVGDPMEEGYSFPSGHVTAVASAMMVLSLRFKKRWIPLFAFVALVMGFSRIYLIAHYPSDVFTGIIVGIVSGYVARLIAVAIYKFLYSHSTNKFCNFVLNFDILKKK